MRIWIVNPQTGSPEKAANPRYLKLARHFMEAGHEVLTFNSSQREHVTIPYGKKYLEKQYGCYRFVHVSAPFFKGNSIKRMLSLFIFAKNFCMISSNYEKPDVILQNIHPPFDYPVVKLAKRLKCKYVAEAWDLWPEDFVTFGLVKRGNPALKLAYAIEKRYYYNADEIIFTFLGAFDYLIRQGWMKNQGGKIDPEHLHYINNGIDMAQFDEDKIAYPREDADMNDPSIKKVVYLGSINKANNVKALIDAAALMQDLPDYRFFIYGNGSYRKELMDYVKEQGIGNVVFKEEKLPFPECAWVVSQSTVNIMNYEKNFGWAGVSSGKMFLYLAAGKPIVCNIDIAYDNVIRDNDLGFAQDITTAEGFVEAIRRLAEQPQESYYAMCERVRKIAARFDYKVLAGEELRIIER